MYEDFRIRKNHVKLYIKTYSFVPINVFIDLTKSLFPNDIKRRCYILCSIIDGM